MCVPCTHTRIHRRVFIYIRLFIKLNTSHNVAAHTQTHTRTNTHGHADARTPFQISCWRCINFIITSSSSSPSTSQQAVLPLLLLLLLCRTVVVIVFPAVGNLQTNTHKHTRTSLFYVTGTKCLSLFPHKLHSTIFSIFFTLRTLARFQIFLFLFSLRVDCAIRAVTLTLRSEVTALSLAVSTQRSSAHL